MFVSLRPHSKEREPLPRRENISEAKLLAEGFPSESHVFLGWLLNTRKLSLALPEDKFLSWNRDRSDKIKSRKATLKEIDTIVGRFYHSSYVVPLSRHFLNQIRFRLELCGKIKKGQHLSLTNDEVKDLKLWTYFLSKVTLGLSLNLLSIRNPTKICVSDSSPYGFGGRTFSGIAWRLKIPKSSPIYGLSEVNNTLEFLSLTA